MSEKAKDFSPHPYTSMTLQTLLDPLVEIRKPLEDLKKMILKRL